jgi:DNA gyrase/topoisomerase IV subunit A
MSKKLKDRKTSVEGRKRLDKAIELLQKGASKAETARQLAKEFKISAAAAGQFMTYHRFELDGIEVIDPQKELREKQKLQRKKLREGTKRFNAAYDEIQEEALDNEVEEVTLPVEQSSLVTLPVKNLRALVKTKHDYEEEDDYEEEPRRGDEQVVLEPQTAWAFCPHCGKKLK